MGVLSTGQHPGLTGSAGTAQKRLRGEAQGERGVSMPARARTGEQVPTPCCHGYRVARAGGRCLLTTVRSERGAVVLTPDPTTLLS